jgi:hypothetical protein
LGNNNGHATPTSLRSGDAQVGKRDLSGARTVLVFDALNITFARYGHVTTLNSVSLTRKESTIQLYFEKWL